jgi:2-polyprenyl-3-methyl-5-hydroxy-6-metoxy-1,4-benzoquinol methylase
MSACPLCQNNDTEIVSHRDRRRKPLDTALCQSCGTVYNTPIPTDAELTQFYTKDYRKDYKSVAEPKKKHTLRAFTRAQSFMDHNEELLRSVKSCLDVGAGGGEFVYLASQKGWDVKGIEPNEGYANSARKFYDVDIFCGMMSEIDYPEKSFDLIRLNHVLEHINTPVEFLNRLRSWLKDDGFLYVEVPNIQSYAALKTKGKIFHFGHIFNFSPWTLESCGKLAGYKNLNDNAADTTAIFFYKAEACTQADVVNLENYLAVKASLDAHYSGAARPLSDRLFKPLRKLARYFRESGTARQLGDRKEIGDHAARKP